MIASSLSLAESTDYAAGASVCCGAGVGTGGRLAGSGGGGNRRPGCSYFCISAAVIALAATSDDGLVAAAAVDVEATAPVRGSFLLRAL